MTLSHLFAATLLIGAGLAGPCALASHERFHKASKDSKDGFLAATDPTYVKECGSCHFAYSPGLLPARSWDLHMARLEKHFGEVVTLQPATRDTIARYLAENAADRSPYEGSQYFMARIKADATPYRFLEVPLYREMHSIIQEVISIKAKVKVRTLTNCNACHQFASEGSFATSEMFVPGLTPRVRSAR
jgi:hypothetical protein